MRKRSLLALFALLVASLALMAAGCGGDDGGDGGGGGGGITALPSSSCTGIEYKGDGDPDYLLVSDFPLQGSSRTQTTQIVGAIRYLLDKQGWKAGDHKIGLPVVRRRDRPGGEVGLGQVLAERERLCRERQGHRRDRHVQLGLRRDRDPGAQPGGERRHRDDLALPTRSSCLTEGGPGCEATEPDKYYPTGNRNYTRVVPHDAYQGAAMAEFMQEQGVKSVYVLNDKEAYGLGVATNLRNAAEHLGIKIAGFEAWDPKQSSYEGLFRKIGGTGADAVFLGGLIDENGAKVIKDKVATLGPNDGKVKLFAPDGFTTQQTIDEAGTAAAGMYMSVAGVPIDDFKGAGAEFAAAFKPSLGGKPIDPYAIYGAQAAQVMLDAIAASDGSRASVIEQLFATKVTDGYLGSFDINENGDPAGARRRGRRLHHLQGNGQADHRKGDLSEA